MKIFLRQLAYVGSATELIGIFVRDLFKYKLEWPEIKLQCQQIGLYSMPLAGITLLFVGFVFAYQFGLSMATLGATPYIGKLVSLSVVRELGPAFTALVVGGRIGSGMAAEIGSMKVTEQIDAIRALGGSPYPKLLIPRVIAATFMLPVLTVISSFIAILGGMLIAWTEFKLSPLAFYQSSLQTVSFNDFCSGFFKPFFFGFGTAIIGCLQGFRCETGTAGVGKATTQAVVNISLTVVFFDFLLTRLFNQIWPH
ncbi:MAG: ABC transporter permease [Myxococcaceae bacterium]|nr:ABC transporter permease [Myxococcaceae bacterium]MBH2006111.1 ABC transporter permease [Myxococcaceae bacterium]